MTVNTTITGINDTISALQRKNGAASSAVHSAIEQVAIALRDSMVRYVGAGHPDHPNVQTGRLRASLGYHFQDDTTALVGSDMPYAAPLEYGHRQTMAWGHPTNGRMTPPYPFVRPALDEVVHSGQAQQIVAAAVKQEVIG